MACRFPRAEPVALLKGKLLRWCAVLATLFFCLLDGMGPVSVWGEDYKAILGSWEIVVPFPEGTKKQKDDPATQTSAYEFFVVDKDTMATKLVLQWVISSSDEHIPRTNQEAEAAIRALVKQGDWNLSEERIRVLSIDDMNTAFLVYWAPYYKFGTGNEQTPFVIFKPTLLVEKSGSLWVIMSVTGILAFKEANAQDLQIAEDFMDDMLVSVVRNTTLRRK